MRRYLPIRSSCGAPSEFQPSRLVWRHELPTACHFSCSILQDGVRRRVRVLTRVRIRALLFWLPLVFWVAVEMYWLEEALSVSCALQPGGNRMEVFMLILLWGLPSSVLVALLADRLLSACTTSGCVAVWLLYCSIGLTQWYFILRSLGWAATRLYRRLSALQKRVSE